MDRGAWWATVHGVTKSQTRLSERAQTVTESHTRLSERAQTVTESHTRLSVHRW